MAYKGRPSAKTIAREFAFVVETMVPEGGLRRHLNDMHQFHRQRGITDHHIPRRRDDEHDYVGIFRQVDTAEIKTARTFAKQKGRRDGEQRRPFYRLWATGGQKADDTFLTTSWSESDGTSTPPLCRVLNISLDGWFYDSAGVFVGGQNYWTHHALGRRTVYAVALHSSGIAIHLPLWLIGCPAGANG